MSYEIRECSSCKLNKLIVNKTKKLCTECNRQRLRLQNPNKPKIKPKLKSKIRIKAISSEQKTINENINITYTIIDRDRPQQCESCHKWNVGLDHSHTISRARCKQLGRDELMWDVDNIILECRDCHTVWENASWHDKSKLLTWERKLEFIRKNDTQTYQKIAYELGFCATE